MSIIHRCPQFLGVHVTRLDCIVTLDVPSTHPFPLGNVLNDMKLPDKWQLEVAWHI